MLSSLRKIAFYTLLSTAVFITGSSAQYIERETDLPTEQVALVSCPSKTCLIIERKSTYCSIDPFSMREGLIFSTKSELELSSGTYPLTGPGAFSNFSIRIKTPVGEKELRPRDKNTYSLQREEPDPETKLEPLEWIEVQFAYDSTDIAIERFFLRTSRWPHAQFHVGDPQDIRWFFEAGRNLFLRLSNGGALFPGLSRETILFAPCPMQNLPDRAFNFQFKDGSVLNLKIRVISGTHGIGYFIGRLMEAQGEFSGRPIHISNRNNLAFFGSTRSWGEMAIPTLVLRTATQGLVCGVILDSSQWESNQAVNGYTAYEMTCDERRGVRLPLKTVSYPDVFGLP